MGETRDWFLIKNVTIEIYKLLWQPILSHVGILDAEHRKEVTVL